jgi:hypothetical protein
MVISKGSRFPIAFGDAVPRGVVLMGDVMPGTEYHRRGDGVTGRPVRQMATLEGLPADWRVAGTGEFEYQWSGVAASGFAAAGAAGGACWWWARAGLPVASRPSAPPR